MKKYIKHGVAAVGAVLILIGAADPIFGALMQHDRVLIFLGAVAVAIAGFLHGWQKLQQKLQWPMMVLAAIIFGAADVSAMTVEQALTPPEVTPMIQRSLVTDSEAWLYVFLAVVAWLVFYRGLVAFLRDCSWHNRPRCNYPPEQ